MAESYSTSKKTILERDERFFSTQFYEKSIWAMLARGKFKFLGE